MSKKATAASLHEICEDIANGKMGLIHPGYHSIDSWRRWVKTKMAERPRDPVAMRVIQIEHRRKKAQAIVDKLDHQLDSICGT